MGRLYKVTMAIQSQQQLDAFKNVALQQGYDPKEVEAFMGLASAQNASKQAAAEADQKNEMDAYRQRLMIEQQYKAKQPEYSADTDPMVLREKALIELRNAAKSTPTSISGTNGLTAGNANSKVLGYADQLMNGSSKSIKDIPSDDRGDVVEYLKANNIDVYQLQKEREGKASTNTLKGLFNDYYGGSGRGSGDDLSGKGIPSLGLSGLLIRGRALIGQGRAANYKSTKDALLASLKAITGENGVLSNQDIERIEKLMPNAGANPDYAARQWDKVNEILVSKYGTGIYESPEDSPTYKEKKGLTDVGKPQSPRDIATQNLKNKGYTQDKIDAYLKAKGL